MKTCMMNECSEVYEAAVISLVY